MAQNLYNLSNVAFVVSAIFLIASIFFWFHFKIPAVHDDVSGKKVRRSIAETRARNERTGKKEFKPSTTNIKRGKKTSVIVTEKDSPDGEFRPDTGVLVENKADEYDGEGTGVLNQLEETIDKEETCLLNQDTNDSTQLLCNESKERLQRERMYLNVLEEVMLIHTKEVI